MNYLSTRRTDRWRNYGLRSTGNPLAIQRPPCAAARRALLLESCHQGEAWEGHCALVRIAALRPGTGHAGKNVTADLPLTHTPLNRNLPFAPCVLQHDPHTRAAGMSDGMAPNAPLDRPQ